MIALMGITQAQAAETIGVTARVMRTWLAETDETSHRDMPLEQWRKLYAAWQQVYF